MTQPASAGIRVAFFGGSFDPPHFGHLAVAKAARAALNLDTVLFAPVGAQPLKPAGSTAGFEDRLAMTRLAIEGERAFEVSLADAPRAGGAPNYTLETLLGLRSKLPQPSTLYCLMGADSFSGLRLWHRAAEIPFAAPLIVASRPGLPLDDLKAMLPEGLMLEPAKQSEMEEAAAARYGIPIKCYSVADAAGRRAPFYLLPGLNVEISASQIRSWIRESMPAAEGAKGMRDEELLPARVAQYIRARGLYRQGNSAAP
jgi:nicotinate-nucleotide adenylyltransferase